MNAESGMSEQGLAFSYRAPQQPVQQPLVLLHGLLGSHKNFVGFGKVFAARGYPVLSLDARNHGASFHAENFDYPTMAADLEQLLSYLEERRYGGLDWQRFGILGHSMGGLSAFMYALLYPRRVSALIAVDVVPSLESPDLGIEEIVRAMRATEAAFERAHVPVRAEELLRRELSARGIKSEAMLQFLLLCNLQRKRTQGGAVGYRWACNLGAIHRQLERIVRWPADWLEQNGVAPNPKLPLLLVAGGRSPYVQQQGWDLLLEYFPHSESAPSIKKVVETAYHWPHTEAPAEFRQLVAEFLEREGI